MKRLLLIGMILCMALVNNGCNTSKENDNLSSIEAGQVVDQGNSEQQKDQGKDQVNKVQDSEIQQKSQDQQKSEDQQKNEVQQENQDNKVNQTEPVQRNIEIEPLNESDFIVSDGTNEITLDSLYDNFTTTEKEIDTHGSENNYVGEIYVGDSMYKVFSHTYKNFTIYTSNLNYDYKKADFDTYYITQIDITGGDYSTSRGIQIGDTKEDIYKAYGKELSKSASSELSESQGIHSDIAVDDRSPVTETKAYTYRNYMLSFSLDKNGIILKTSLVVNPLGKEEVSEDSEVLCKHIKRNQPFDIDINHDGTNEKVSLNAPVANDGSLTTISITVNDKTKKIGEAEGVGEAYLLQNKQGSIGILFEAWFSNDYCETYFCKIDKNRKVKKMNKIEGYIEKDSLTTGSVTLTSTLLLFGTWNATRNYEITDQLTLKPTEDFRIINDNKKYITLKKALKVEVKDKGTWVAKQLKGNEKLYPVSTDGKEYMYFRTKKNQMIRIQFTLKDYQVYVNDTMVEELFDGVEIAG
ncbi:MAG TPA: hypothetical protein VHQ24_12200 [Lachnospiraceae bacterium]|nr:hypothetical protein [Lachnospiraceae bacterium]